MSLEQLQCFTMNNNWRLAEQLCSVNVTKSIKIYKKVIRHLEHCHHLWPPHPLSSLTTRVLTTHWRAGDRRPLHLWPRGSLRPTHARVKRRLPALNFLVSSAGGIFRTSYKPLILNIISAAFIRVCLGWQLAVTVTIITIMCLTISFTDSDLAFIQNGKLTAPHKSQMSLTWKSAFMVFDWFINDLF